MVFSSRTLLSVPYTMKTIPVIKTNRSDKKSGAELGDTCNSG